jgi:hypothetical protein
MIQIFDSKSGKVRAGIYCLSTKVKPLLEVSFDGRALAKLVGENLLSEARLVGHACRIGAGRTLEDHCIQQ